MENNIFIPVILSIRPIKFVSILVSLILVLAIMADPIAANKDAARLFEDLLADYNKLVRPVDENNATLVVRFKLKLSQLLDVVSAFGLSNYTSPSLPKTYSKSLSDDGWVMR